MGRRAEIWYDHGRQRWYMVYTVAVPAHRHRSWTRVAGIDLGVRVLAAMSIAGTDRAVHFLGREVLKDWEYYNRQIARHQHALSHRPKSQWRSKQLMRLYTMHRARLRHTWDAVARRIVAVCRQERVGTVVIGWPKYILQNTNSGRRWNGRIHGFWSFEQMTDRLTMALARAGVRVERIDERTTSSVCCRCGSVRIVRRPRHVVTCQDCHLTLHADRVGSRNILRKAYPAITWDGAEAAPKPETLRWTKHRWVDASNPPRSLESGDRAA
jgi:IS605 OrfB family transposase